MKCSFFCPNQTFSPRPFDRSSAQVATPFADVPYSVRKAGISFWIASGVDATEVARRAGHSVAVLYKFYARVLDGRREQANALIEQAMRAAGGG